MPFTRISLLAGKSAEYVAAVAKALDRALVDCFDVPEKDRFVAVHQHQPGELIFDRSYRGGPRSDDYIFFHITTGKTRSDETKARFYRRLVENLAASPGVRPQDVMVVITNSTFEDWSFASGISAPPPWSFIAPVPASPPRLLVSPAARFSCRCCYRAVWRAR